MMDVQKITSDALRQIIDTRQPLGLFYALADGVYTGVDNRDGNAWTEAFPDLRRCKRWLLNPHLSAGSDGAMEKLMQNVKNGAITTLEISEELTYRENSSGQKWNDSLYGYSTEELEQAESRLAGGDEV